MRLLKWIQKYAAIVVVIVATALLTVLAGTGRGELINRLFGHVVTGMEAVLMLEVPFLQMPLIVAVLFTGAVFFTFRFRFINFRAFKHGVDVLRGKYDNPDDPGDVSHAQALSSALSATVGLGNIAGVAIAVSLGGPGAVLWMMIVALFGMSSKFAESTLGQLYRQTDSAGEMRGGPMVYLRDGLAKLDVAGLSLKPIGWFLSILFALLCIGTSLGAGNMFQANQSFAALSEYVPWIGGYPAEGTVRLTSPEPVELESPRHQMRFVVPPDGDDRQSGFRPLRETGLETNDWHELESGQHAVPMAFQSETRRVAGRLELRADAPLETDNLVTLVDRIEGPGDETQALEKISVSEDDWTAIEPEETHDSEAWNGKPSGPDAGPDWTHRLELAFSSSDGEQSGSLVIKVTRPVPIEHLNRAIHRVAPALESLGGAEVRGFMPTRDISLSPSDWNEMGDHYAVDIPVQSERSGEQYNVSAESVTAALHAELTSNRREIARWMWQSKVDAVNPEPLDGGENQRAWLFGVVLAILVGLVIIGGIKSIAKVAEKIVPAMCTLYILAGLFVIAVNFDQFGGAVWTIVREAIQLEAAGWGGLIGVFVQGVRRAAFSSEAGIGSAPIAHSAAKTDEPVREGMVAMLGPFIDTIVVCFITGMVIVISGVWARPSTAGLEGVTLTAAAFGTRIEWFPIVLSVAVVLFAFSTMISWSYYGERCWTFLFGDDQAMAFRFVFLFFIVLGSVSTLGNVLSFGDYLLLSMAFPNILGVVLLSNEIDDELKDYWDRYRNGEFETYD